MELKFKKRITMVLVIMILVLTVPLDVIAINSESTSSHLTSESSNDLIYKESIISPNANKKKALINEESDSINLSSIIKLSVEANVKEIENSLYNSDLRYSLSSTDNIKIKNNYNNIEDNSSSMVILTSNILHSKSGNKDGVITKTLGEYLPKDITDSDLTDKYNGYSSSIYIKNNPENIEDVKFILRYYIFREKWGLGVGPADKQTVYVQDYDFTPIIRKVIESKEDTKDFPIINYLKEEYLQYFEIIKNDKQKDQQDILVNYKNSKSLVDYKYKSFIEKLNEYYYSEGSKDIPSLPEDINFTDQFSIYMYAKALSKSKLFDTDLSKIILDTTVKDDMKVSSSDWELPNRKVIDLLTAVKEANRVVDSYYNKPTKYTSSGIESNAAMFKDITLYRYGKMSGASERGLDTIATDKVEVDDRFESLLVDYEQLKDVIINPMLWDQRDRVTSFGYAIPVKDYLDLFSSLQLLEDYSKYSNGMSGVEIVNNKAVNTLLEKEIERQKDTIDDTIKKIDSGELIRHVKTYRQIKEGLDFLGIKPWTKELTYIYDKYKDIENFVLDEEFDNYDETSDVEPLKRFFSFEDKTLSSNYLTGVALSATYIPMQTNLYDPTSIRVLKNESWLRDFHMRYGFYRKALMMDVNVNAAVDGYVTGSRDSSRPVVLRDLLEYKKDIVLYVDDNFYNTKEVAEMTDKVYERLVNTEQAGTSDESFEGRFDNLFSNSIEHTLKTGPKNKYDDSLINIVTQYNKKNTFMSTSSMKENLFTDGIIMSSGAGGNDDNEISNGLNQKEYSIKQSYSVVSGIYRHKDLAKYINNIANNPIPVFVSSPTLFNVQNVPRYEFGSIYNYYMLRNLKSSIGVDYRTTLDLDNPLYIDIYGNILTESGLVVIPAASNSTLYPKETYTPYTLGFMDLYSNGDNIKYSARVEDTSSISKYLNDFEPSESGKVYLQKNYEFNGVEVNPQRPSLADSELINVLYDNQVVLLNNKGYNFDQRIWLITEVLRGAPIENIDKQSEGIIGKRDVSKYGLYMSWKLDEIADMLLPTTNGNSIISMPNITFMDGVEYLVLFAFKFMLLLFVAYIMYRTYIDAIGGKLGLKTLYDCVITIAIFSVCIVAIPEVISMSYNETNKIFLQDEIKYINLLNYEKSLEGREISAVGVTEPKSQTKLYLKLDTIKVPWYKVLKDVMFAPVGTTLEKLYEEELQENILYGFDDVQVVNDGVYIDVDDVFKSSSIIYKYNQKFLYQNMNTTPTTSYFTPYYYIMDNLLYSVNSYNRSNSIINVTTKIQSDGSVKTMGMIGDYLLSEYFLLEESDPLGLYDLYSIDQNEKKTFITNDYEELVSTKSSMWYVKDQYSAEDISSRIDQLYSHMRSYVAKNREMIGRVTDETFIKTMMLDVSMEYNNLFRIPAAKGIEVFSIDSRDLIRLSITDENTAVTNASNSFGKFVYDQSGGLGVILTAILLGIYFIASIVKPAMVIFICSLLVYNVLIKRMINNEKGKTIEGLLYVLSILVIINSVYAVLLKLSMSLPNLGLNPSVSIIGQICIQAGYLFFIFKIVGAIFKDLSNFGYNIFNTGLINVAGALTGTFSDIRERATYSKEQQEYMEAAKLRNKERDTKGYKNLREEMDKRDNKREEAEEDNAFMENIFKDKDKD